MNRFLPHKALQQYSLILCSNEIVLGQFSQYSNWATGQMTEVQFLAEVRRRFFSL
jgi:lysine/ornithine N-monooxygenase